MPKDLKKQRAFNVLEDERIQEKEEFRKVTKEISLKNNKDLKIIVEERKKTITDSVMAYISENDLQRIPYAKMYDLLSSGNTYNRTQYSSIELMITFEVFKSITSDMTLSNPKHFPSKQAFCTFIGVSTSTYDRWKLRDDMELVEMVGRIDDYLTDIQLTMAQNGLINPGATMFRMKTEHGYIEPKDFIAITNEIITDTSDIRQRFLSVKNKT